MRVWRWATNTDWHGAPLQAGSLRQMARICSVWLALLCASWSPHVSAPFGGYSPPPVQARSTDTSSELRQQVSQRASNSPPGFDYEGG